MHKAQKCQDQLLNINLKKKTSRTKARNRQVRPDNQTRNMERFRVSTAGEIIVRRQSQALLQAASYKCASHHLVTILAEGIEDELGGSNVSGDSPVLDNNAHVVVLVSRNPSSVLLGLAGASSTLIEDGDLSETPKE
jgi:hypothetical protein